MGVPKGMVTDHAFWTTHCHLAPRDLQAMYPQHSRGWWTYRLSSARAKYTDLTFPKLTTSKHDPTGSLPKGPRVRGHRDSTEMLADGSCVSNKLLDIDPNRLQDKHYILDAHGFDPAEWEVVALRNSEWEAQTKDGGTTTLFASQIKVRPARITLDIEAVMAAVRDVEPITVHRGEPSTGGLLEVGFVDMHLGPSTLEHYIPTMERTVGIIRERPRDLLLLTVGNDLFHNDNHIGTTQSGTAVDPCDWPKCWADATAIYRPIIEAGLEMCAALKIVYVTGNHDASMAWAFIQMLAAMYPQVECDTELHDRKIHRYGSVCIGFVHGEKAVKDFDRIFMSEFAAFATAPVREIHTAHRHHEVTKDTFGVVVRTLPTASATDKWHRDNGYVGANKRFQLFEYASDALTSIRYV